MRSKSSFILSLLLAATGIFSAVSLGIDARPIGRDLGFVDAVSVDDATPLARTNSDPGAFDGIAEAPILRCIHAGFVRLLSPRGAFLAALILTVLGHLAGAVALFLLLKDLGHPVHLSATAAVLFLVHPGLHGAFAESTEAHGIVGPALLLLGIRLWDRIRPGEETSLRSTIASAAALFVAATCGRVMAIAAPFLFVSFVIVRTVIDGFWSSFGRGIAARRALPILGAAIVGSAAQIVLSRGSAVGLGSFGEVVGAAFFLDGRSASIGGFSVWTAVFAATAMAAQFVAVSASAASPWAEESGKDDAATIAATAVLAACCGVPAGAAAFFGPMDRSGAVGVSVLGVTLAFVALASMPFLFVRSTGRARAIAQGIFGIVPILVGVWIGGAKVLELRSHRASVDRLLTSIGRSREGSPKITTVYFLVEERETRFGAHALGGASTSVLTRAAARTASPREAAKSARVAPIEQLIADWGGIDGGAGIAEDRAVLIARADGSTAYVQYVENPWASGTSTLRFSVPKGPDLVVLDYATLDAFVERERFVDVPLATIVQWLRSAPDTAAAGLDRLSSLSPTEEIAVFDLLQHPVRSLRHAAARLLNRAWGGDAAARIAMILKAAPTAHASAMIEHLEILDDSGTSDYREKIAARPDLSGDLLLLRSRVGDEPTEEEIVTVARGADPISAARADLLAARFDDEARARLWARSVDATLDLKSRFDAFSAFMRADDETARTALWTFLPTIFAEESFGWAAVEAATPEAPQTSRRLLLFVEPQPQWPMRLRKRAGAWRRDHPGEGDHERIAGAIVDLTTATLGGGSVPAEAWSKIAKSADDPEIAENMPEANWVKTALKANWGGGKVCDKEWRWSIVPRPTAPAGAPLPAIIRIKNIGERPIFGGTAPYALKLIVLFREVRESGEPGPFSHESVVGLPWTMIEPGATQWLPVTIDPPPTGRAYSIQWRWGETLGSTVADLPEKPTDRLDLR